MDKRLLLASPHMSDEGYELEYIHDAFRKNWIAPLGENVNEFEKTMGAYMGRGYPVALSAGTAALHLAMILAGVKPGDTVFCQSLTFSASANPVAYCGAKPVFIDSERETWNMDPVALHRAFELHGTPKAVVAVHLYGNPAKLDEITAICREHGVPLIEDAAEALGSTYNGQKCGTFGEFGGLSFNGNKIITTSGGGMLLCRTEADARHALKLATQARENAPWYQHEEIGYNYRMSNISAGIGRGQMKVLPLRVRQKQAIFNRYCENLKGLPLIMQPKLDCVCAAIRGELLMRHRTGFYEKYGKRFLDFFLSGMALIILSPILLVTAILVRVKLGSPVIFCQERPGKDEQIFKLHDFKSSIAK